MGSLDDAMDSIDDDFKEAQMYNGSANDDIYQMQKAIELKQYKLEQSRKTQQNYPNHATFFIDPMGLYSIGTGTHYSQLTLGDDERIKKLQEEDKRRHLKIFTHFAKMFCERFPNWELQPDANDVFHKVLIAHKNGKYRIVDFYPDNQVQLQNAPSQHLDQVQRFSKRHGIPQEIFKIEGEKVITQNFYGWALGMDDVPDFIKE